MSRQQIQDLEERASQHYLRGEYDEAARAWREVLALEPENEQAAEGVRMSGILLEGTEGMPVEVGSPHAGSAAALDAIGAPGQTLLLDPELLATIVHAPAGAPSVTAPAPLLEHAEPERHGEGFDFGSLEELDSIPLFGEPAPVSTAPVPQAAPAAPAPARVATGDPASLASAAAELTRRVQDLLTEARSMHAEGRHTEALGVLARVAILDEENEQAQSLESEIRAAMTSAALEVDNWIAEGVQAYDRGSIQEAKGLFERVLAVAPEHREALHYLEAISASPAAPGEGSTDELLPGMAVGGGKAGPTASIAEELREGAEEAVPLSRPAAAPAARPQPPSAFPRVRPPAAPPERMARRAPGKIVWVAGGFGAIVILAGVGWWFLGRGNAPPRATAAPPPAPRRAAIGSQRPGTAPAAVGSAAPAASASDRPTSELLAEARTAIASRDYGAAVLAYNEILGKEPDNAEAKDGLARAGEDYKARKAEIEQLDRVKMAFAEQEFTSALHVLYRFPKTADKSVIDRYKVNGWYNLGIVALKGGGCAEARSHFDEALAIRSGDEGVRRLRSFAERYVETSKDRAFYDQVESLSFRGVDE